MQNVEERPTSTISYRAVSITGKYQPDHEGKQLLANGLRYESESREQGSFRRHEILPDVQHIQPHRIAQKPTNFYRT